MKLKKILAMLAIAGAVSLLAEGTTPKSNKTIDVKEKGLQDKKIEKKVDEEVEKVKEVKELVKTKIKK